MENANNTYLKVALKKMKQKKGTTLRNYRLNLRPSRLAFYTHFEGQQPKIEKQEEIDAEGLSFSASFRSS
ncbi:hypothetical protein HPP92_005273 [Vanilla planifolia]|uniref:Uncharacterized protein n=1 Tax=Vanilla planifolia TaxID=51239 RepID=A0A835RU96_VANPL|nr:hypothetical protein HPP92_005560 [Vanilla planifolia]KAG0494279.1 hypothetical protein HPP92_005273 [Vanilla planifolia]